MTINEAAHELWKRYVDHDGVTSIGVADHPDDPHIVIYTKYKPGHPRAVRDLPTEIGGFRVDERFFGKFAPLGGPVD